MFNNFVWKKFLVFFLDFLKVFKNWLALTKFWKFEKLSWKTEIFIKSSWGHFATIVTLAIFADFLKKAKFAPHPHSTYQIKICTYQLQYIIGTFFNQLIKNDFQQVCSWKIIRDACLENNDFIYLYAYYMLFISLFEFYISLTHLFAVQKVL